VEYLGPITNPKDIITKEYLEANIPASGDLSYTHNQVVASNIWTIIHSLAKYPSVSVVDSAGTYIVGDIEYTDINTVTVTFTGSFSGKAFLN